VRRILKTEIIIPETYEQVRHEWITELDSQAVLLRHKKSGARVFLLKNSDENKVFTIGFRTPPPDSTGLPHILEHSVLCGSDRFPLKDPFMELAKSSLQTFLNAMTFSDKTLYPVASCNDQDFRNLMGVYMDAVFHPFIYKHEEIFMQEGWHYELNEDDGSLSVNGVVYNEMKGAYSSPDDILARQVEAGLYPDTAYANDSGGDPEVIPSLSYEAFIDFHSRYYHPSNSYIYLYGDIDMQERLEWMDREYLSHYEEKDIDSRLMEQPAFTEPRKQVVEYPITTEETPENKTWLSSHWSVGEITDPLMYRAFEVLDYVLLSSTGGILKKALRDAGIGKDIFGGYHNETLQPYFSLVAKDTDPDKQDLFEQVVHDTLTELVEKGIDEKYLLAGINSIEFTCREADYGSYPKGLVYAFMSFDSWLYDDGNPFTHLRYENTLSFLKENVKTGYYEGLIRTWLIDNPHRADIMLKPVPGLMEKREEAMAMKLKAYRETLSEEELGALTDKLKSFNEYQGTPSTPEELATLPALRLSDISEEIVPLSTEREEVSGRPFLIHRTFAGGVSYVHLLFNVKDIEPDQLPLLSLLGSLLCNVDTEVRAYSDLANEIAIYTGGMGGSVTTFEPADGGGRFSAWYDMSVRVLDGSVPDAFRLIGEVLTQSVFTDKKYIYDLIREMNSRCEMTLSDAGHVTASRRARSYSNGAAWFAEKTAGIDFFNYIQDCCSVKDGMDKLAEDLARMLRRLVNADCLTVDVTAGDEGIAAVRREVPRFISLISEGRESAGSGPAVKPGSGDSYYAIPEDVLHIKNEGFKTAGQVVYAAMSGNYRSSGIRYTGVMQVLRNILSSEYLWKNIRELGGAYGCMCHLMRNGDAFFVSYRDPHFRRTIDVFDKIAAYVSDFAIEPGQLEKYIISTIGSMDRPLTPCLWGSVSLSAFMNGVTDDMRRRERREILSCTQDDIRRLAPALKAVADCRQICVVGNAATIDRDSDLLKKTVFLASDIT
jgi:Zn-dependent M16 (insulinase) family peptidase